MIRTAAGPRGVLPLLLIAESRIATALHTPRSLPPSSMLTRVSFRHPSFADGRRPSLHESTPCRVSLRAGPARCRMMSSSKAQDGPELRDKMGRPINGWTLPAVQGVPLQHHTDRYRRHAVCRFIRICTHLETLWTLQVHWAYFSVTSAHVRACVCVLVS